MCACLIARHQLDENYAKPNAVVECAPVRMVRFNIFFLLKKALYTMYNVPNSPFARFCDEKMRFVHFAEKIIAVTVYVFE